jgi:DNA polymerase-3 subunit gamma/tau
VLKLVHAQRMLPLEQILSQASLEAPKAASGTRPAATAALPSQSAPVRQQGSTASPFEIDRARKNRSFEPDMSAPAKVEMQNSTVGAAVAIAVAEPEDERHPEPAASADAGMIMGKILSELENAGHKMLASTLESGIVELKGGELIVNVQQSAAVIDMIMGPEPRRIANAAGSAAAGRPLKVTVAAGAAPRNGNGAQAVRPVRNGAGARSRAAEDPVVRRMQEKFGAEIRTVIDHREKT